MLVDIVHILEQQRAVHTLEHTLAVVEHTLVARILAHILGHTLAAHMDIAHIVAVG